MKQRQRAGSSERMSKVDTAWLRMDSASNLMMIIGVWTLRPGIRHADLCARMQERLLQYDRFRQRVEDDATGMRWVDHDVDIREHVVREALPRRRTGGDQAALQQRIAELAMKPLDRGRPHARSACCSIRSKAWPVRWKSRGSHTRCWRTLPPWR
jgi:diacylglycerol O-acyltransferase